MFKARLFERVVMRFAIKGSEYLIRFVLMARLLVGYFRVPGPLGLTMSEGLARILLRTTLDSRLSLGRLAPCR